MNNNETNLNQNKAREAIEILEKKKVKRRDFFHSPKGDLEVTDMRFANYFINLNEGKIVYNRSNKEWLVWSKPAWKNDESLFYEIYLTCIETLYSFANKMKGKRKEIFVRKIVGFQSFRRMTDMLGHASKNKAVNKEDKLIDKRL